MQAIRGFAQSFVKGWAIHWKALVLLLLLFGFHAVNNWVFLKMDNLYFVSDARLLYLSALDLPQLIQGNPWSFFTWDKSGGHPPLFVGASALFMRIFGASQDIAVLSNLPFLAILLVATYFTGYVLFDKKAALLSAVLLSFFPGIFAASRGYYVIFPLTAGVTLAAALLLYTEGMTRRIFSLLFGFSIALAALTYPSFSLFLIGPFISEVVIPLLKRAREGFRSISPVIVNLLLAALVACALALPWYVRNIQTYLGTLTSFDPRSMSSEGFGVLWALERLIYPIPPVFVLLSVIAVIRKPRQRSFLLSWLVVPLLLFTLLPGGLNEHIMRAIIPVLPAIALLLGQLLCSSVRRLCARHSPVEKKAFAIALSMLLLFGLVSFFTLTYAIGGSMLDPVTPRTHEDVRAPMKFLLGRLSPFRMQADVPLLVTELESEFRSSENLSPVFILNSEGVLTDMVLTELRARRSIRGEDPFPVSTCWRGLLTITDWLDEAACIERIDQADYVLLEDFSTGFFPQWFEDYQRIEATLQYLEGALPEFVVFGEASNSEFRWETQRMNSSGFLMGRFLMLKRKAD